MVAEAQLGRRAGERANLAIGLDAAAIAEHDALGGDAHAASDLHPGLEHNLVAFEDGVVADDNSVVDANAPRRDARSASESDVARHHLVLG